MIEDIDWDEDEIKIIAQKSMDRQFSITDIDISFVKFEQIIGIAPEG